MSPEIRLVALVLLGAIFTLGLGMAIGRWMIQRHESRALVDARSQLARRRSADIRNEREVAVLTQARLVDAADLDALRAQLDAAEALQTRVGQVEQQSMTIERLYRQLGEQRQQLTERRDRRAGGAVVVQAEAALSGTPPLLPDEDPATVVVDDAAVAPGEPAADLAEVPAAATAVEYPVIESSALSDSVDISAFEAANRIANGVPRARSSARRKNGSALDRDDLTLIEGVGPRVQSLCYAAGITTWQAMAETPVDRLVEILAAGGPRYVGQQPQSWPDQAASLAAGERDHALAG